MAREVETSWHEAQRDTVGREEQDTTEVRKEEIVYIASRLRSGLAMSGAWRINQDTRACFLSLTWWRPGMGVGMDAVWLPDHQSGRYLGIRIERSKDQKP